MKMGVLCLPKMHAAYGRVRPKKRMITMRKVSLSPITGRSRRPGKKSLVGSLHDKKKLERKLKALQDIRRQG